MKSAKFSVKRCLCCAGSLLVPLIGLAVVLCRGYVTALAEHPLFPDCYFYTATGYLCPACGNTRAVLSLIRGHLLQSLAYNPMILILTIALAALYAEMACYAFGKRVRILPRSNALLFTVVGIVLGYNIVRNFIPELTALF